jgi:hypothetical protein
MKYIKFSAPILLMICFIFCAPHEKEITLHDELGRKYKVVGVDAHNACYTFYYDSGTIRRKLCLKDSLTNGLDQFFFENGSLYRSTLYRHDTLIGMDTFFYETGEVHYLIDAYKDGKINGKRYYFNKDGTLKAFNLVENDSAYYIKTYSYDSNKIKSDSAEAYYLLIETERDTFKVNDTVNVRIYLPECHPPYDIDRFVVLYDFYKVDGRTTKYPGPILRGKQPHGGFREKLVFKDKGEILIGTQLDYEFSEDSIMWHGMSNKSIYIIE